MRLSQSQIYCLAYAHLPNDGSKPDATCFGRPRYSGRTWKSLAARGLIESRAGVWITTIEGAAWLRENGLLPRLEESDRAA